MGVTDIIEVSSKLYPSIAIIKMSENKDSSFECIYEQRFE